MTRPTSTPIARSPTATPTASSTSVPIPQRTGGSRPARFRLARGLPLAALGLALAWLGHGAWVWSRHAPRPPLPRGEIRGAYHVHTTWSEDGRGTLAGVVRGARRAGMQFVVVTDHNVVHPEEAGYREGVLVVQGSEISSPYGHVVALGMSREPTREESQRDVLGAIRDAGGRAVLAHPLHPARPFTRWSSGDWQGYEAVSNDSFWGRAVRERGVGRILAALGALPFDPAQAVLAVYRYPAEELSRYDALDQRQPGSPAPTRPRHPLLCAADAHGWPSYRAAFEAFSMHLPIELSGDPAADARAVVERLLDGSAVCVFDGVAPASGVRLSLDPGGDRIRVEVAGGETGRAAFRLVRDGSPVGVAAGGAGGAVFACGGPCRRGAFYRVEATWDGRPWIFTSPVWID